MKTATSAFRFIFMKIKVICIRKVSRLGSFWNTSELVNGLLVLKTLPTTFLLVTKAFNETPVFDPRLCSCVLVLSSVFWKRRENLTLGVVTLFLFASLCKLSLTTLVMNWLIVALINFDGYWRFENVHFKYSHSSIKCVQFDDSLW